MVPEIRVIGTNCKCIAIQYKDSMKSKKLSLLREVYFGISVNILFGYQKIESRQPLQEKKDACFT